jgi:hypothetical protein
MPFSDDTSLVEMAQGMGVDPAEIDALPDRAKKLTKGELLALWGAEDTDGAVTSWEQAREGRLMPAPGEAVSGAPLDLTLEDVATVQALFSRKRVRPVIAIRDIASIRTVLPNARVGGSFIDPRTTGIDISCCCCPCCCATAEMQPAAQVA